MLRSITILNILIYSFINKEYVYSDVYLSRQKVSNNHRSQNVYLFKFLYAYFVCVSQLCYAYSQNSANFKAKECLIH